MTLRLEGKLIGPWVDEVRQQCQAIDTSAAEKRLDLAGVTFVDQCGTSLLRQLLRRGYRLVGCSNFVAELLQMENA